LSVSDWTIIDTETTGLAAPIYTLEIAAQRMRGLVPIGNPFRVFLNHEVDVPPQAQAVHGYSRKFIQEKGIPPHQAHSLFAEYANRTPLAAYNLPYDYDKVLMPEWKRLGLQTSIPRGFCVMRLTQKLLSPSPAGNYKLQSLRSHFSLPDRSAHSALGDVLTVVDLLGSVLSPHLQRLGLSDAIAISRYLDGAGYSDRLPFGKHKGKHWKDAVNDQEMLGWLQWLARQDDQTSSKMAEWYLAKVKSAAASDSNRAAQKELFNKTVITRLKGTKHYGAYEAYRKNILYSAAKLDLKAEPQNPHDSNAVSVWIGTTKLGYISRDLAAKYQKLVLSKQITSCMISSLELASNISKVEIYVKISYQDEVNDGIQDDSEIPNTVGVYEIRLDRGRCYIGSTYDLRLRRRQHLSQLQSNTHVNVHLQRDFNILGEASLHFSVLAQSASVEAARTLEKEEIYKRLVGGVSLYNCTADGQGIIGEIGSMGDRTISDIYAENPAILEQYFSKGSAGASLKISPTKTAEKLNNSLTFTDTPEPHKTNSDQLPSETARTNRASPLSPNFTGKGRYEWPNGDYYEGDFINGERSGKGILKFASGSSYTGDFVADKQRGKGIFLWPNGDRYEGDFFDDKQTGKGIFVWADGKRYKGDFIDNKRTGKGLFVWPNGDRYDGDFVNDYRAGKGRYFWPNGNRYEGDFFDGKLTGKGIFVWPNGNRYEGDVVDGKLTGQGVFVWPNGDRYQGGFVNGRRNGTGVFSWHNGCRYDGEFVDDIRIGKGVFDWPNGQSYEGDFVDNQRTGKGVFTSPNGESYEGDFVDNQRTGKGLIVWPNGDLYEGDFVHNQRTGKGIFVWSDGKRYEGDFLRDKRTGKGALVWPNGKRYEGDFVEDKRTGKGICLWPRGSRYEGDFLDNKMTGKGIYTWPDGNRYLGDFINDQKSGKGIFLWANGDRYEGDFVDGKQHGTGIFVWHDGNSYRGDFVDDTRTGKGVFVWRDGNRYEGDFVDGKMTGKGIHRWPDLDRYEGNFIDGKMTGKGAFIHANGGREEGDFVDGQYQGFLFDSVRISETSILTWPDGRRYEGQLVNGKRTGFGSIVYPSGDRYVGDWVEDHCTGKGVFEYANGDRYEGDFVDGRRVGKGCLLYASGSRYEGRFLNNVRHGVGKEWLANGDRYEGQFYENCRHGIGKEWLITGEKYEGEFKKNERSGRGILILSDGSKYKALFKNGKFVERLL